jgi:ribosomal protein S18 acetylase RimI-like enzyme
MVSTIVSLALTANDRAEIDRGLDAHNKTSAPLDQVQDLSLVVKGDQGRVLGGLIGRTWGDCAEIQQLWVDPGQRRQGLGANLLQAFLKAARERGCTLVYLETFSFQAPTFYQRHGFRVLHEAGDFAPGIQKYWMRTDLC